jgi:hypothetical protein
MKMTWLVTGQIQDQRDPECHQQVNVGLPRHLQPDEVTIDVELDGPLRTETAARELAIGWKVSDQGVKWNDKPALSVAAT